MSTKPDIELFPQMDRRIISRSGELGMVECTRTGDGRVIAKWIDGDFVFMTPVFLEDSDPEYVKRMGNEIQICQYRLRIVGVDGDPIHTYIGQRIRYNDGVEYESPYFLAIRKEATLPDEDSEEPTPD